jgi:GH3 auxin-responsive promoter
MQAVPTTYAMGFRATLSKPFAAYIARQQQHWISRPVETQLATLQYLLKKAKHTVFGANHGFADIRSPEQWAKQVPLRDYEGLREYVDLVVEGKPNILWPGRPVYYAKTSGTTSGVKYIPITADSIPYHIHSARNALLNYVHETGRSAFLDRKLIFLSGSPTLEDKKGVKLGRLSGIVNHHVPGYLRTNQLPAWETNIIEDW